mgnify:CR=1 FL=1
MRKAVLKRIKFTRTGKVLRRRAGHNHFNAKMGRSSQLRKKGVIGFAPALEKKMKAYANQ